MISDTKTNRLDQNYIHLKANKNLFIADYTAILGIQKQTKQDLPLYSEGPFGIHKKDI